MKKVYFLLFLLIFLVGCGNEETSFVETTEEEQDLSIVNPPIDKCLKQNGDVEMDENGMMYCIKNNKKCEIISFFNGDCILNV